MKLSERMESFAAGHHVWGYTNEVRELEKQVINYVPECPTGGTRCGSRLVTASALFNCVQPAEHTGPHVDQLREYRFYAEWTDQQAADAVARWGNY